MVLEDAGTASGESQSKAKIFISYSRKDMACADRLEAGLEARGFDPLIDRTEIFALEDWWRRIEELIAQADTIVFVLSPDAVTSSVCQREVSFAASLNKRLAPIVYRRVEDKAVPEQLARLNFIFFDDDSRFDESLNLLVNALETDIEWVRKHTEFGEQARRWALAGRPGPRGLLLRSPVLEEAERWIASRPAGAPPPTEEAQAFIAESRKAATQRRKILSGSLAAGLAAAIVLTAIAFWQRAVAVEQRDTALISQSRFLADLSRQLAEAGDQGSAAMLAMEALPDPKNGVTRPLVTEAQDALYQSVATLREVAVFSAPDAKIVAMSQSADGNRVLTRQQDRTLRVWDTETNRLLATLGPFGEGLLAGVLTRTGDRILLVRKGAPVEAVEAITGAKADLSAAERALWQAYLGGSIRSFSADGRYAVLNPLAAAELDPDTGLPRSVTPLDGAATEKGSEFRISANGATVVSNTGTIWDGKTGKVIAKIDPGEDRFLAGLNVSPDGSKMVWQEYATAFIYDVASSRRISVRHPESETIKGHERAQANIYATAFSPDGKWLATASADKTTRIWDVPTGELLTVLDGHRDTVRYVHFLGDGKRLLTLSDDGTARIWAAIAPNEILPPARFQEKIITPAVRKGAVWLVAIEDDNSVTVWDYTHNSLVASLRGHTKHDSSPTVDRAYIDPDGTRLVTEVGDGTVRVWNLETGTELSHVTVNPTAQEISDIGLSRDGRLAYAAADDLYVWEVDTGKVVVVINPSGIKSSYRNTYSASFSPGGTEIVAATDGATKIWDVATGQARRVLTQGTEVVRYSPDGRRIAVVPTYGEEAVILDAATGNTVLTLVGHGHFINALDYSPDGRQVLTTSEDSTARLWNAATGQQLRILTDVGGMFRAHFSPDGNQVLTESGGPAFLRSSGGGSEPWRGRLWPVFTDTAAMMDDARTSVPRCLTRDQRLAAFLEAEPPAWCIGLEKWPYEGQSWKDWLKYARANLHPPFPDTPGWKTWLAARH